MARPPPPLCLDLGGHGPEVSHVHQSDVDPALASVMAMTRPRPRAAPVTTATGRVASLIVRLPGGPAHQACGVGGSSG